VRVGLDERILDRLIRIGRIAQVVERDSGRPALVPFHEFRIPLPRQVKLTGGLKGLDVNGDAGVSFSGRIRNDGSAPLLTIRPKTGRVYGSTGSTGFRKRVILSYLKPLASARDVRMTPDPILVVDDDPFVLGVLSHVGRARGLEIIGVQSIDEAEALLSTRRFSVAVVDLRLGAASGLDVIKRIREFDNSTEAIVISADRGWSSALERYEQDIFAFVPKPFDPAQLFATVDRAVERRRGAVERQRLTWELRLLNELAAIVASSIEIDAVLHTALERVATAFEVEWAVLRLIPIDGAAPVVRAVVGATDAEAREYYADVDRVWPSDTVMTTRQALRVDEVPPDPAKGIPDRYPARSALSVPIVAGPEVLGVLSVVSTTPRRFSTDDERVLLTIGQQFGVAVANGQLYERVHRAKVQWERTFDAISDPITLFDSRSRSMRTNAALAALRGWDIRETQGRTCAEVGFCGGGCPDCLVGRAIRDGTRLDQEITTTDGRIFLVTTMPVPDAAGAAVQFAKEMTEERNQARQMRTLSQEVSATNAELVVTLDRLRSTQAQLVQAEKLSAIGQLVAGVAHELNNPLTSVIGYAQLVHEEVERNPLLATHTSGLMDDVSRILSESDRAARIVRNLLTFARRQTAERSKHDIAELCSRVVDLRAYDSRLKGIEVVVTFAPDLPPVYVDGGQVQQALLNLVLNAEQAMQGSTVKRLDVGAVMEPECGTLLITVSDTGHGIDVANMARVFDPFFTTRGVGEGTGLGLSIVYGIVRDHGGQIWVTSHVGRGTSFFVRLPVRGVQSGASPLVLVAHSDAVSRDFIGAALGGWGLPVRLAPNAREALESLREDELDLAIIDRTVVDPDPTLWRDAWAPVRDRVRLITIATGAADDEAMKLLRESADVTLTPPYDLCVLRRALVATLGERI
jgi:two-component system NtrC family sensor kinase